MPLRAPRSAVSQALRLAIGAGLLASCGAGGGERACGEIEREPLDPASLVHVLGTDVEAAYASDPPTSGPHQQAPSAEGVLDAPLTRPVQVGILERGDVLVQHLPDLEASQVDRLQALAGERVVVAPNPDLRDPVVVTAWTHVRRCSEVDIGAVRAFIRARAGKGPEGG